MTNTLSKVLAFTAGAVVGGLVTWKIVERKYAQIANEEIDSMREYFKDKYGVEGEEEDVSKDDVDTDPDQTQIDIREYAKQLAANKYTDYSGTGKEKEEVDDVDKPYVISPEELGELDGYETTTLYYHANGILTDDQGEVIEDADDIIGIDPLNHFGQYEPDSVCVRDDARRVDYEILYDSTPHKDGVNTDPYLAEG